VEKFEGVDDIILLLLIKTEEFPFYVRVPAAPAFVRDCVGSARCEGGWGLVRRCAGIVRAASAKSQAPRYREQLAWWRRMAET
jgi:hypothetical protein